MADVQDKAVSDDAKLERAGSTADPGEVKFEFGTPKSAKEGRDDAAINACTGPQDGNCNGGGDDAAISACEGAPERVCKARRVELKVLASSAS